MIRFNSFNGNNFPSLNFSSKLNQINDFRKQIESLETQTKILEDMRDEGRLDIERELEDFVKEIDETEWMYNS
ncbi:hypothetical protein H8356DRAFT_1726403 [Neocallimastix lanati (nom. inval.)]|uniref:Uncharacterized protein n=1 Tax=Neocallimastix californiae TaxID=1754190 RepID=A0A1Y2BSL2_9FUNG|nr:hypothetical protein H8356DRAFT_1726403 [Neocallimastix sp. JGI-2020a]ORY37733.1 hypothetical protein LY90DRAFT_704582 [Neocallimastix californiae]|eukprot:ORY37733.1 hypothetical protein LY90DRAFT_704582 [Neocallimastix californiae]